MNGHLEIVKLLADYTNNPNYTCRKSGMTAIHVASLNGHLEIVKFLANFTDNPNSVAFGMNGLTPIHIAAGNGHLEIVKFLAGLTNTPNAPDSKGKTPIYYAKRANHSEIVKFLEKCGEVAKGGAPPKSWPIAWVRVFKIFFIFVQVVVAYNLIFL